MTGKWSQRILTVHLSAQPVCSSFLLCHERNENLFQTLTIETSLVLNVADRVLSVSFYQLFARQ